MVRQLVRMCRTFCAHDLNMAFAWCAGFGWCATRCGLWVMLPAKLAVFGFVAALRAFCGGCGALGGGDDLRGFGGVLRGHGSRAEKEKKAKGKSLWQMLGQNLPVLHKTLVDAGAVCIIERVLFASCAHKL